MRMRRKDVSHSYQILFTVIEINSGEHENTHIQDTTYAEAHTTSAHKRVTDNIATFLHTF